VKIQPEERPATTSEPNPARSLVTGCCEAGGTGYQATIEKVKVISPEILIILEADVFCVTEGSIHITVSPIRARQGAVSPAGSKTVAWYQTVTMGTREAQYALFVLPIGAGVCDVKPMNGKIPQMAYWESDQPIVLMKQGNSCGGKGLTGVRWAAGTHLPHPEVRL
jgi:hypothetical protein